MKRLPAERRTRSDSSVTITARAVGRDYNVLMSLESISRVVSNALKAAATVNGGTPDEKGALDVLGGLAELLESRIQLHKRVTLLSGAAGVVATESKTAVEASSRGKAVATAPDHTKPRSPDDSDNSYDLK